MASSKYHFIGIGGIGMSGLARILLSKGAEVSGSDINSGPMLEALKAEGANISLGHSAENVPLNSKVIYTTGLSSDNSEYIAAKEMGCPILHRSDLLAELTACCRTIAVAGMHGKTTTSAMIVSVLTEAGRDPSYAIGGILGDRKSNAMLGSGPEFIIEACESDGTFLKYTPTAAIVTNIDLDHMDFFLTENLLLRAFKEFCARVSNPGQLIWCGDDERLKKISLNGSSYGFSEGCEWRISNYRSQGRNILFDLAGKGRAYENIALNALGKHNALNGTAVFVLALSLGISEDIIRRALRAFQGVGRRCEIKGHYGSVLCIDDYAHHPVEVKTTLQGIKEAFGHKRLVVAYQPHRYTRFRDCLGMYSNVFDAADEVVITDIYAAGEQAIPGIKSEMMVEEIKRSSAVSVRHVPQISLVESLKKLLQPNDLLLTLGAGNITSLASQLIKGSTEA